MKYFPPYIALLLGTWLSTGTLSPNGFLFEHNLVGRDCGYLFNIDHQSHHTIFLLLDEASPSRDGVSVMIRRILYPVLAYPFMNSLGFYLGGLLTNVILHSLAFFLLIHQLKQLTLERRAVSGAWLFATYPGISYWIGLPYSYAFIVPGSVLCMILLHHLDKTDKTLPICLYSFALGFLALGYDFLPNFGVAACVIVAVRTRKFISTINCLLCLILPILTLLSVYSLIGIPVVTDNSAVYGVVLKSYLPPVDWLGYLGILAMAPKILINNYLFSGFLFLPIAFLLSLVVSHLTVKIYPSLVELSVLFGVGLLWVFLNFAPPYEGWQMRGEEFARLYQPIFIVFIFFLTRFFAESSSLFSFPLLVSTVALNFVVILSPLLGFYPGHLIYWKFYHQSTPSTGLIILDKFGRRPLGFCQRQDFALEYRQINPFKAP